MKTLLNKISGAKLVVGLICLLYGFLRDKQIKPVVTEEIRSGQIWTFEGGENPFRKVEGKVRIKDYKDGWVNYEMFGGFLFKDEVMEESSFRYCYRLSKNPANGVALVIPQAKIKEKIISELDKSGYKEVIIHGTPQYVYKPNHAIVSEIIEVIRNMDLTV